MKLAYRNDELGLYRWQQLLLLVAARFLLRGIWHELSSAVLYTRPGDASTGHSWMPPEGVFGGR